MEEKKNILTYEGLKRYEEELHELKVVRRHEVAQKIKEAREQVISFCKAQLRGYKERFSALMEEDETEEYSIVGSTEANSLLNKISNESPVGKALIGAAVGDTVSVSTPAGEFKYEVLEIRKTSQN